jgi:hypothetical protein
LVVGQRPPNAEQARATSSSTLADTTLGASPRQSGRRNHPCPSAAAIDFPGDAVRVAGEVERDLHRDRSSSWLHNVAGASSASSGTLVSTKPTINAGTTWAYVRGAEVVDPPLADSFVIADYEVPNGTTVKYRARATYYSSGLPITSAWTESSNTSWTSTDSWLKAPGSPTLNVTFCLAGRDPYQRTRRSGVFHVLGAAAPVVVSDVRSKRSGRLVLETQTTAEAADVDALLEGSQVVLVWFPASMDIDDMYAAVINHDEQFRSTRGDVVWRG